MSLRSGGYSDSSSSSSSGSESGRSARPVRSTASMVEDDLSQQDKEELLRIEERDIILSSGSEFRQFAFALVESRWFSVAILAVIFINTIFIAVQTSEYVVATAAWYVTLIDQLFLAVYIVELLLKLYVWRLRFFKISWNVFDFTIVLASLVDFLIPLIVQNIGVFDARIFRVLRVFRAIRALRALRVIRTIRFLKNLQIIVSTVLHSIPALGSIVMLISLVLYIFAIIGRGMYGKVDPDRFGNLAQACFTLFQLITLDDWFYMYSDVRDRYPDHKHILIYLLLFIILETFIFINLFVAVIVDNLSRAQASANAARTRTIPGLHKHKQVDQESEIDIANAHATRRTALCEAQTLHTVDYYYKDRPNTERGRELLGHYLTLLASIEHHRHQEQRHLATLHELVDLADFSKN